jgi:hypothetical protein
MLIPTHVRSKSPASKGSLAAALPVLFLLSACAGGAAPPAEDTGPDTAYGAPVPLGAGNVRAYVVSEGGVPVEIGVAMDEGTLTALPPNNGPGSMPMPDGNSMYMYQLELPAENPTPFHFVTFDWNPVGHEPPGVYDVPHFDAHFYLVPDETLLEIDPANPAFAAMSAATPAAEFMPPGHIQPFPEPAAIPMMGVHWVDPVSPELAGTGTFSSTHIFGTWNGALIFMEPMFTLSLLESRPNHRQQFPVPSRFATAGQYPSEYSIRWDEAAREYRIALAGFQAGQ